MAFVSAIGAFANKWLASQALPLSSPAPAICLAEVEEGLDRTGDAFVDALNLLERCLPRSFGA